MSLITGDGKLFNQADTAATTYEVSEVEEAAKMIVLQKYMDNNGTGTATMNDIKTGLEAKGYTVQTTGGTGSVTYEVQVDKNTIIVSKGTQDTIIVTLNPIRI